MLALEEKLPYIHNRVGFNFRMTEMQSIVGINELARLETWNLPRRFEYAKMYREALGKLEGVKSVSVNFMTQKLTLEADDAKFDEVLDRVVEFTADAEPDCEIIL